MPIKVHPLFNNFSSGEISPKLDGRTDLTQFNNGLQELRNWLCVPQGGVKTRGGFHFAGETKSGGVARLIPFEFSELQNYILEFGNSYIRFWMDCGQLMEGDATELVVNGEFPANITSWDNLSTGTGTIAFDTDHMAIAGGTDGVGWAQQAITVVDATQYLLSFDVATNPLYLRIGTTPGGNEILNDTLYAVGTGNERLVLSDGTLLYFQFKNVSNVTSALDNVSVQLAIPYEIYSPYLVADDLWLIRFTQDDENLYLIHPLYPPMILTRGVGHRSFSLQEIEFIDGPYEDELATPTITPSGSTIAPEKVTNGGFDEDADWTKGGNWTIEDGVAKKSAGGLNNLSQDTSEVNTERYKVVFTINSISGGTLRMSIGGVNGTARSAAGTYTEYITATGTGDLTFTPSDAAVVCEIDNVSVYKTITLVASDDIFLAGHSGSLWRLKHGTTWGYVSIEEFTDTKNVTAIVRGTLGGVGASAGFREGSWSDVNGFPRAITFHEGKLLFASNYEHPETIWASKSGKYNDFTPGTLDNDAYSFTTSNLRIIRWMAAGRVLCIGALNEEATAVGPTDGPITVVDPPRIKSETTHGSSDMVAPVRVGKAILFLQRAGTKIREFVYSYTEDAYGAPDLTMASEHLFQDGIIDLVHQQEPDSILWGIRGDGSLVACTYDRYIDQTKGGIVGWSKHDTDGLFESLAVIPYADVDQLWAIVARTMGEITISSPETETFRPGESADDCTVAPLASSFNSNANYLFFGLGGWMEDTNHAGFRFKNLTIPKGATITAAKVTFQAYSTQETANVNIKIEGQNSDSTSIFSSYVDFTDRPRTTAHVDWDNVASWTADTDYDTPDIKDIIQEIVDRPDWDEKTIVLFFSNNSSAGYRDPKSWDNTPTNCARLIVTWTVDITTATTNRFVEYYDPEISLDCGLTYSGGDVTTLKGLEHLAGKTVQIVGDGAPYAAQVVPATGELIIDPAASDIYVGLSYSPTLTTNRPEVSLAGTSQGLKKRWNKIIVRLLDTTGITVNGQIVPARDSLDLMGEAPEPFTGDVNIENLGWDTEGRITIVQALPLPAHVVAIMGTLAIGDE